MAETAIQWTDKMWNPATGCTRVSEGCRNCYAFTLHDQRHVAHKAGKKLAPQYAKPFKVLQLFEDRLADPLADLLPATEKYHDQWPLYDAWGDTTTGAGDDLNCGHVRKLAALLSAKGADHVAH